MYNCTLFAAYIHLFHCRFEILSGLLSHLTMCDSHKNIPTLTPTISIGRKFLISLNSSSIYCDCMKPEGITGRQREPSIFRHPHQMDWTTATVDQG